MFILVDDRMINVDDISIIEPDADYNMLTIYYRSDTGATTSIHYENTEKLVEGLQKFVDVLAPKEIPGAISIPDDE